MKKSVRIALIVLCIVLLGVFIFSGYKLFSTIYEYKAAEKAYAKLQDAFTTQETQAAPAEDNGLTEEKSQEELEGNKEVSPITVDFDTLKATSQDVQGWIYCGDTVINYPIAQGEDNNQYLHHLLDGTYNSSGTLFIDCECAPNFAGANTIIYGHNMKNGSMFNSLHNYYTDPDYYTKHPVMYINTPDVDYKVEIFSGFICNYDSDTYTLAFGSEQEYADFLGKMQSQSDFKTDVQLTTDDRIVTLSTCTYEYDNARYVIMGRLVPLDR